MSEFENTVFVLKIIFLTKIKKEKINEEKASKVVDIDIK